MKTTIKSFLTLIIILFNLSVSFAQCPLPSTPSAITVQGGSAKVCSGDSRIYSTAFVSGVTYNWSVPVGASINSGQGTNSINVTYNTGFGASGIISVVKNNSCGNSAPRNLTVRKNIPATPSAITGQAFGLCGGRNIIFSVQAVPGNIYNWTVPGLAHIVSGQGTNSIKVNFQSVNFKKTISVTANNGCTTSAARTLVIRSAPQKPTITGSASVCPNSSNVPYSTGTLDGAVNYTWIGPAGSTITANGITSPNNILTTTATDVTINFGNIPANATVRVRANNSCGSSAYAALPLTSFCLSCSITIDSDNDECFPDCNGTATVNVTGGNPPYTYNWTKPSGEFYQDTQTATGLCGGTYTVYITDNNGNTTMCETTLGGGTEFTLPDYDHVDIQYAFYCPPYCDGSINVEPFPGPQTNYTYQWSNGETTAMIDSICGYTFDTPEGYYTITVTDGAGCTQTETYFMESHRSFLSAGCITQKDESFPGAENGIIETFIFHGQGPFTYEWSNGSNDATIDNLSAGSYTVTVTDGSLCTMTTTCEVIVENPRLGETSSGKQITAQPNPFAELLNVNVVTDESLTISIKDIAGKIIHIYNNISSSFVIDDHLKSGVYSINIENQTGTYKEVLKVVRTD